MKQEDLEVCVEQPPEHCLVSCCRSVAQLVTSCLCCLLIAGAVIGAFSLIVGDLSCRVQKSCRHEAGPWYIIGSFACLLAAVVLLLGCGFCMHGCERKKLEGVDGSHCFLNTRAMQSRNERLDTWKKELYHETSPEAWSSIKKDYKMLRSQSSNRVAGAGIYFAMAKEKTEFKALQKGVMITCQVRLGRMLEVGRNGQEDVQFPLTFRNLAHLNFDSVHCKRDPEDPTKDEFVVYNSDQVEIKSAEKWPSGEALPMM